MAEQTIEHITTRGVKVIGADGSSKVSRYTLLPLAQTHSVFNDFVSLAAQEIVAHLKGNGTGTQTLSAEQNQLVTSFLRVVFKTGAAEGNHLLTRLLQTHGEDGSDRKQIVGGISERSGEQMPGVLDRTRKELSELPLQYRVDLIKTLQKQLTKAERVLIKPRLEALKESASLANVKAIINALKQENLLPPARKLQFKTIISQFAADLHRDEDKCRMLIDDCSHAEKLLDLRKSEFAPWKDLGVFMPTPGGAKVFCRIADLSESWQRQIFQATIESLKSNINLEEYVVKEVRLWKAAQSKLENLPDITKYRIIKPQLESLLGEHVALNRMTPTKIVQTLQELGTAGENWRGQAEQRAKGDVHPAHYLAAQAKAIAAIENETDKKRASQLFRRDFAALCPEVWTLLNMHQNYKRLTGRQPGEPTLTIPHKFDNPKHVMWSAAQYRGIQLLGEGPQKRGIRVKLPVISVGEKGVVEGSQWYTATGDPRLESLSRERDAKAGSLNGLKEFDRVTGRWRPVSLGAIRLVPSKIGTKKLKIGDLEAIDYKLKVTLKRDVKAAPEWVREYAKGKTIDPRTNEPQLPEKLLVISFLPDLMGKATMKAAIIEPPSNGQRRIKWIAGKDFVVKAEAVTPGKPIKEVASPADVLEARNGVKRLIEHRSRLAALLLALPEGQEKITLPLLQLRKDLPRLFNVKNNRKEIAAGAKNDTMIEVSRRQIRSEIASLRRCERLSWDHVTALGEARANGFAGEVARQIEQLRPQYPGHEIAFVTEHRQERSASKAIWSKAFNSLVMSAAGASVHNKILETVKRLDPAIAVFERSLHGLSACDLSTNGAVNVLQLEAVKTAGVKHLVLTDFAAKSVVFRSGKRGDVNAGPRMSVVNTMGLLAEGLIRLIVNPSRQKALPEGKAPTVASQKALFAALTSDRLRELLQHI